MKTIEVKIGTRKEILEYVTELRKVKTIGHNDDHINTQLDYHIMNGHNYIHLELTELVPCGHGSSAEDISENFIIADFSSEHQRLMVERMEDNEFRDHKLLCWEQLIKIEKSAELRQGEYFNAMILAFKDGKKKIYEPIRND
jgi:hypothetical protein